jgi:hypothetical protein
MLLRNVVLASAIAALLPAISNASSEQTSLQACARAFATSLAGTGAQAPAFKVDYQSQVHTAWSNNFPTEYTFTMEAHDAKSGAAVGRARCSASSRGVVKDMATLPLTGKDATLAAR